MRARTIYVAWLLLAAAPGEAPMAAVRATLDAAGGVVRRDATRAEKLDDLAELAEGLLDTDAMGRSAMAGVIETQSPAHRAEFLRLFGAIIVARYLQKLVLFREPDFEYLGARRSGDSAHVRTHIRTRKDAYRVDYAMHWDGARWRATDFVVEGVSFVGNYRDQFQSLLRTRSFDEVLDLMRRKIDRRPAGR